MRLHVLAVSLGAIVMAVAGGAAVRAQEPLTLESTIQLDGVSGRIDHMAVDLDRGRLMVAELGNNTLGIVDLGAKRVAHRITGLKEPQGVAYLKAPDLIAVANAGDGSVRLFHAADFAPAGTVALGDDADNLRVAPDGHLIAGHGRGGLAVIDAASAKTLSEIALPAHPEGFRLHPADGRVYVNLPDAHQIAVVDRRSGQPVTSWGTLDLSANFPMAISDDGGSLYVVYRRPARLVVYATDTGTRQATIDVCGDSDDVFADAKRKRVYVSCGEGFVDVLDERANGLQRIARVATSAGARTALFVPEIDRLFVAARAAGRAPAAIRVFRPGP